MRDTWRGAMVRDHQPGEAVFRSILLEDIDSRDVTRFWTFLQSLYARARLNGNLELSRSGNGVRNGFRRPDGRGGGQSAESALDTLYVARNRNSRDLLLECGRR